MTITPGLAAELELLTQALDLPGTDIARTLTRLADDAQQAVPSYLGLCIEITVDRTRFDLIVLDSPIEAIEIRTSLRVPLTPSAGIVDGSASLALVLYAARAGAFVDLAADLSWITGRPLHGLQIDEHIEFPPVYGNPPPLTAMSTVNQAIGVLIGRGSTPGQAQRELSARSASTGLDLAGTATLVLAGLVPGTPGADRK